MKYLLQWTLAIIFKLALSVRYKVIVKGKDKLTADNLKKSGGVLFLPNHPSYFADPCIVSLATFPQFPIRPMIVEYMYYLPVANTIMRFLDALPVPNFVSSSNSYKRKKSDQVIGELIKGLKNKENFLIYPAGRVKHSSYELIGGSSAVHRIVQEAKEANIVLVRITGLWGSSFSRALTHGPVDMVATLWEGIKIGLKNLLFFTPRREVIVEFEIAPSDFPYKAGRLELNRWLENYYNKPFTGKLKGYSTPANPPVGEPLVLRPYYFWNNELPKIQDGPHDGLETVDVSKVPQNIQDAVKAKLAELSEYPLDAIKPEMSLSTDLGLDSLDTAEVISFLSRDFAVDNVPVSQLGTVATVMGLAAHQVTAEPLVEEEAAIKASGWNKKRKHALLEVPVGKTLIEVFLNNCERMKGQAACVDARSGIMSYDKMKLRVIVLAEAFKELPGQYIGVLLPASVAANLVVLALQLAGKIPLMINWTVGPRHLQSVRQITNVECVLTSWAVLDRLDNVDLEEIEDKFLMLEEVAVKISLWKKVQAKILSKRSTKAILKHFGSDAIDPASPAGLLFTSGTESLPKGVPLSHENILSNLHDVISHVQLYQDDVILGILPPFHSFGFSVTGLYGLLVGMRCVYFPNPTDGKKIAEVCERWGVTVVVGAPTFIRGILQSAKPGQLEAMRICVTGAEKAPPELLEYLQKIGKGECLLEGYGITECSPVLTANRYGEPHRGVGCALASVELTIIHPETSEDLPQGESGMILARGPNVFKGYVNSDVASPFVEHNGKMWYKTGDLGYLDAEGFLYISGRLKRFIKIGGEMVSLGAIEDVILQTARKNSWIALTDVPTFAVIAKEVPGDRPKIYLFSVFNPPLDDLNRSLRASGMSNLVRINSVIQVNEIPIMGTGKVNYRQLESQIPN